MNKEDKEESELIALLVDGDQGAFSELYERYSRGIFRKFRYLIKNGDEAEELTQELFARLWEKRSLLNPQRPLIPYLLRMAGNLAHDFYRRSARDRELQEVILASSSELYLHTEEDLLVKESRALIDRAIASLPEQQRAVFALVKLEGKSYREVAQTLGIGEATVSTHVVRATKSVRKYLFETHGGVRFCWRLICTLFREVYNLFQIYFMLM